MERQEYTMKKAVHFGAGNIGRGFIGQLLHRSGYHVTFVDVNAELVNDINELGKYTIEIVSDTPETEVIDNVSAINSKEHPEELTKAICEADLVTTAIGPNILKFIAPNIAAGLTARVQENTKPLNIIACENMVGGTTVLKNFVYEHLDEGTKPKVDELIGFPDAAVDRIVPIQHNEEKLLVQVEPFSEWDVDSTHVKGERPEIEGLTWTENLPAYIERKLFTLNTGHASVAYAAYQKGIQDIYHAMQDEEILKLVRQVWAETSQLIIEKHGFASEMHQAYVEKIESRFKNPHISDDVTRVARGPIRKLGAKDRLVAPATQLLERGHKPEALATVIAAALKFDCAEDQEAVELQGYLKEHGLEAALTHYTGIEAGTELYQLIMSKIK